ncbi:Protein of unknown function [Cotesia congregata]|uniref:CCHC-type domain-containing protein n=1 Tax=Cotesia congregata TaxID=51543 RepID=A0A8J2H8D6_COTCN|nr:Protein of unknown function [Cotesia congregata]
MELTDSQNISLHDALTFVLRFEGDSDELIDFISCCQDAKQIMPEAAEANLAKLIYLAKLSSNVKLSLNHVIPITIEGLVKALKRIYVSSKSIYQLQGELGCTYQQTDEPVIDFLNRIRRKSREIIECHSGNYSNLSAEAILNFRTTVDTAILEVFTQNLNNEIDERMPICTNIEEALTNAIRIERKLKIRREIGNRTKTSKVKSRTIENFENFTNTTEACQICDNIGHTAKECPQIIQSDIHREIVNSGKVTPLSDKIREFDSETGYETSTSESGKSVDNLEIQKEQVIDRFTEPAAETQNTSLQEKEPVIEVRNTSIQDAVDAPKTRRGRPRRHRVKFKERRLSPHEVTPLLDPDTNSELDSAIGEDTSSESDGSIKDLLQCIDDNTVQVFNSNRQPDDEGLRIQKLSDT